jgi:hypothetical protein
MKSALLVSVLFLLPACQPEPVASADGVGREDEAAATVDVAVEESPAAQTSVTPASATPLRFGPPKSTPSAATPGGPDELSLEGIGPVKLGMTYASLVWAGLEPEFIDGGVAVGPYRAGFTPSKGGPIVTVHVKLGDLPNGLLVGGKLLKNETTSLQELADAVGECEPIPPIIGGAETTCHGGRVVLRGAGPVGGLLTVTVKSSAS